MIARRVSALLVVLSFIHPVLSQAKVYRDIKVGDYGRNGAQFDISDCGGKTFLTFMKEKIYPAIETQFKNTTVGNHIDGVKRGQGVELRLSSDVTTYHVKFEPYWEDKAERSGRSFSAVGKNQREPDYVADASYKHYLSSLQEVYERNPEELPNFYRAILGVIATCDASGFSKLRTKTKEVAADFVAVYVAEQYRHLLGGKGKQLGRSHNWDDALLQVTLLASFHAGQAEDGQGMYYEGRYTSDVYNQLLYDSQKNKYCLYKQFNHPKRAQSDRRGFQFIDYWQFNKKCDRSGVNVTRSDFQKMGKAITDWMSRSQRDVTGSLERDVRSSSNLYQGIGRFFISNSAPETFGERGDLLVDKIVGFLASVNDNAADISESLE